MGSTSDYEEFCDKHKLRPSLKDSREQYDSYCKNLDFFPTEVKKSNRGGVRAGSGRKTKYESTKVVRVPENYLDAIKSLISHLDENSDIDHHYSDVNSEPVFIRSLTGKKQNLVFVTKPIK